MDNSDIGMYICFGSYLNAKKRFNY